MQVKSKNFSLEQYMKFFRTLIKKFSNTQVVTYFVYKKASKKVVGILRWRPELKKKDDVIG